MPPPLRLRPRLTLEQKNIYISTTAIRLSSYSCSATKRGVVNITIHPRHHPTVFPTRSSSSSSSAEKGKRSLPAVFVRSGTSTGLVLRATDLPPCVSVTEWRDILASAMGSPDPVHGRQLDGMGGGVSSTSKVCVLAEADGKVDVDVDFTFVQVGIRDGELDMAGNCGNMSAIVGPLAWDWGFVKDKMERERRRGREKEREGEGDEAEVVVVRVRNTNTGKIIHSRFKVGGGVERRYSPVGEYVMDGVPGSGSRITLSFIDPAGAKTGRALPTGNPTDILSLPDGTKVRVSLVDVSNPGVFVTSEDLGLPDKKNEMLLTPAIVEADEGLKARLEMIRREGAARMGLDPDVQSVPKVVVLLPPLREDGVDLKCLAMSMGQAHKAVPLTLALCLGVAANIEGTVAHEKRKGKKKEEEGEKGDSRSVVIGHPSGTVEIGATFRDGRIVSADLHRTARVLMKGEVYY